MTPRKVRVSRATRREEIALRLFAAAERLLDEGTSFASISVEQLITGAEIARSTFYVYFEDKGALVLELADRVTRQVGEAASAWFKLQPGATRDDLRSRARGDRRGVRAASSHARGRRGGGGV